MFWPQKKFQRNTTAVAGVRDAATAVEILFVILALFTSGAVGGRAATNPSPGAPNLKFSRLGLAEGLSQADVRCIVRDRQGFMWFGTGRGGLNRYDGYGFKVYRPDEQDERSLGDQAIWALFEDRQHTLWVGTQDKGVDRYDPDTDSFIHYRHREGDPNSLPDDTVKALYEDEAGVFWVGTIQGLSRFDRNTGTFFTYRHEPEDPSSLGDRDVRAICLDRTTGLLWIGTRHAGVSVLDRSTGRFTRYSHVVGDTNSLSDNAVNHIFQDRAGTLWVSTRVGLNRWNPKSKSFVRYRFDPNHPDGLGNDYVSMVHEDRMGRFWVATGGGLDLLDRDRGTFFHYRHDPSDPSSLSDNDISTGVLYEDNLGALWIGTQYGGVNRLAAEPEKFATYRNNPADPNSLSQNTVSALYCDRSGNLWVGTGEGLDRFDGRRFVHYRGDPKNPNAQSPRLICAIIEGAEGKLWVGTQTEGLYSFDGTNFTRYRHDPGDPHSLGGNHVNAVQANPGGGLWIALHGAGLNFFDGRAFTHFIPHGDDTNSLPSLYPISIFVENAQSLWVGVAPVGLYQFEPARQKFTGYSFESAPPRLQIPGTVVSCFDGTNLWAGSYCGLFCFDLASRKYVRRFTEKDGLANDWVLAVQVDLQGNVWVSTVAGLSKLDVRKGTFRNYDVGDGLQSNQFCEHSQARLSDGRLAFGGVNGLNVFDPEQLRDNTNPPPVVLTDFELFNVPVTPGTNSPLKKAIHVADQITLRYDQEVIRFKFAALNYDAPQENHYGYRLEGFDQDWRYVDASDRSATYTRLSPGNYTFRVKASNNDGVWNEQGASIQITVLPPWWATWWFRTAATTALLGAAFAGYRRRVSAITRRAAALELEVAHRTRSLSERTEELASTNAQLIAAKEAAEAASRAKSEFLSSMSHELRTPLNAILGYTQILAQQDNLTSRQHQQLDVMYASGEHLLMLISDILDLSRIEARRLELTEAPFRLPQLLEQTIEITKVKAEQKHLALLYETDPTLPECVRGDERRVRQILLNLLSNAVKFTAQGSVTLRVKYDQTNGGSLKCEVADTGVGIASDKLEAIFEPFVQLSPDAQGREGVGLGLTITRRLATLMGGMVTVESRLGLGSTFRLSVPLPPATLAEESAQPVPRQIRGYRGARKQVLVADDNPTNVGLLVAILEPLGFKVLTARNGREALRQALERPPDLVLLDLVMPEMDGLEAVRQMRQHKELNATRIVGVSATVTGSDRKRAFAAACDGFLGKPIQVPELLQTIERSLQIEWDITLTDTAAVPAGDGSLQAPAAPPPEVIAALRRTVERGEFGELERLLKEEAPDAAYAGFCQQIRQLAARYDDEGIAAYLDRLGKATDENRNK